MRRSGNREPAKGFGQETDIVKLVLLESSLTNSGEKCQDTLLVSTFVSIQTAAVNSVTHEGKLGKTTNLLPSWETAG